jgi:hypothetical protein
MVRLALDQAGEWSHLNKEWGEVLTRLNIDCSWSTVNHNSAARAEVNMLHFEVSMKSVMLTNSVPVEYYEECGEMGRILRNLFPLSRNVRSKYGDTKRPLEEITNGYISRIQCNKRIANNQLIGVPALVPIHPKVKGSKLKDGGEKAEWRVSMGMHEDCPLWMCPWRGTYKREKDYWAKSLLKGQSFRAFFGFDNAKQPKLGRQQAVSLPKQRYIVHLKDIHYQKADPVPRTEINRYRGAIVPGKVYTHYEDSGKTFTPDDSGKMIECDLPTSQEGDQVVRLEIGATKLSTPESKIQDQRLLLADDPMSFEGKRVCRRYQEPDGAYVDHEGLITRAVQIDREWLFHVYFFHDHKTEEWDFEDVEHYVINKFCTGIGVPEAEAVQRPDTPEGDSAVGVKMHKIHIPVNQSSKPEDADKLNALGTVTGQIKIYERRDVHWRVKHVRTGNAELFTSDPGDTFHTICDKMGVETKHRKLYFNWLGLDFGPKARRTTKAMLGVTFLHPWEGESRRKIVLRWGSKFPVPQGPSWLQWIREFDHQARTGNMEKQNADCMRAAFATEYATVYAAHCQRTDVLNGGVIWGLSKPDPDAHRTWKEWYECEIAYINHVTTKAWSDYMGGRATPAQAAALTDPKTGKIRHPNIWRDIIGRPDFDEWKACKLVEWGSIVEREVLGDPKTLKALREMGILGKPVPIRIIWEIKSDPSGALAKFKARAVLTGHPAYLQRGRDFWVTFSASPSQVSERIMQFICVQMEGALRDSADLCTAYLFGKVRDEERIPVIVPEEYKPTPCPVTGEPRLYWLRGSLYGHPSSDRRYTEVRNKFLTGSDFNSNGWVGRKCRMDPCVFVYTHKQPGKLDYLWLSVHTDDISIVTLSPYMRNFMWTKLHARFKIKKTNPENLLGLTRVLSEDGLSIEIGQEAYISDMYETFKPLLKNRRAVTTPVPPGMFLLAKDTDPTPPEVSAALRDDYLQVVGKLAWAGRMSKPECSYGVQHLCKKMAAPSQEAFDAALHMVKYMFSTKERGIKLSRTDNPQLRAYYDASHKADPTDKGRCQGGYMIYLGESPIDWRSWRLPHVGQSSSHDEYMALAECCRTVVWLRQLLEEMGLGHWCQNPSIVMGDNDNATALSQEDIVTIANRFYHKDLHYSKEQFEAGTCCTRRIDGKLNVSDPLTKALDTVTHDRLTAMQTGYAPLPPLPPKPRT